MIYLDKVNQATEITRNSIASSIETKTGDNSPALVTTHNCNSNDTAGNLISDVQSESVISARTILDKISLAQKSYRLSKDSAARAAAYIYMVWCDTLSPSATAEAREWLNEQVIQRNRQIHEHNAGEDTLRKRVKAFNKNKLAEYDRNDRALQESDDSAEKVLIEAARKLLNDCCKLTAKEWSDRKMVPIQSRSGASQFASLVKFVLELHHSKDTSTTARYSAAVGWIHDQFEQKSGYSAQDIVDTIQATGGFDRIIDIYRGTKQQVSVAQSELCGSERQSMAKYASEKVISAYKTSQQMVTVQMHSEYARDGLVVLIGRQNGDHIELVSELDVDSRTRNTIFSGQAVDGVLPTQDAAEFLGRFMTFAELVDVKDLPLHAELGLSAGQPIRSERILSMLPDDRAGFQLQVSACHADACVIVTATPRATTIGLGRVEQVVYLTASQTDLLGHMVSKPTHRRMFTFSRYEGQEMVKWTARNVALDPTKFTSASRDIAWNDMSRLFGQPLEVVGYKPFLVKPCSMADILKVNADIAAKSNKENKSSEAYHLKFNGHKVVFADDGSVDLQASIGSTSVFTMNVNLRIQDAQALFALLSDLNVDDVTMSFDKGGLVTAEWSDDLGSYQVFVPTYSSEKMSLISRRFEPMAVLETNETVIAA